MRHNHDFNEVNPLAEQRTRLVVLLTVVMMIVEITAGWRFQSMALLVDGWHMGSHAIALGLSAAAYTLARRLARDERFAFGTWKIEILGGYTSAVFLAGVVVYMIWESVMRLMHPAPIAFNQAIGIACLGLLVNLCSAWLLAGAGGARHSHSHGHDHDHDHGHDHAHHHDLNLRSAYVHVAADAATSVLAIAALTGGKYLGATWLDPLMGIIGSVIVAAWPAPCCAIPGAYCWMPRWTHRWWRISAAPCAAAMSAGPSRTCTSGAWARASSPACSAWCAPMPYRPMRSARCCLNTKNSRMSPLR